MITLEDIKKSLLETGKFWIVFTGNSITSCEWVHPNWREILEYVLKEEMTKVLNGDWRKSEWGIRTFNFAYDGATTKDIVEKIDNILLPKPDLVIGLMGGNDPAFSLSIEDSIKNISTIIAKTTEVNAKIIWSTSTPAGKGSHKNREYQPYVKALTQSVLNSQSVQIIDMFNLFQKFPLEKFFTFISEEIPVEGIKEGDLDLTHPNQLGNAYIAKVFLEEVFGVSFDPEKFMETTLAGEKYPQY